MNSNHHQHTPPTAQKVEKSSTNIIFKAPTSTVQKLSPLDTQQIPYEIVLIILSYLNCSKTVASAILVNKSWRKSVFNSSVWKSITLEDLPLLEESKKYISLSKSEKNRYFADWSSIYLNYQLKELKNRVDKLYRSQIYLHDSRYCFPSYIEEVIWQFRAYTLLIQHYSSINSKIILPEMTGIKTFSETSRIRYMWDFTRHMSIEIMGDFCIKTILDTIEKAKETSF